MSDITVSVALPSQGKLYGKEIQWQNELRAPRLRDRGLGSSTKKLKLQSSILDKTLLQPLGISTYDLHTADFVYLNLMQRQLSKGYAPYKINLKCPHCKKTFVLDFQLETLPVKPLTAAPEYKYTTRDGHELELTFVTPRMLDECVDKATDFMTEYPDTDLAFEDLKTRELLRFIIKTVDGERLTYARMTQFLDDLYSDDADDILQTVNTFDFGVQFKQETICDNCGKKIVYLVPQG